MNKDQIKSGQIIRVRNRLWRVDTIYQHELIATSIDSISNKQKHFFIPMEPITSVDVSIPDLTRLGELSSQDLLLRAYAISLIHGSSPLMSLHLSTVIPANFQLVPVIMALNNPRVRLLIADDVGLGKTIEAGLIINELIARQMARRVLIVCPANLREQWQEAMQDFFRLNFNLMSSINRKSLEKELPIGVSPWDYYSKIITSIDYAKRSEIKNELLSYNWDLVIFDEGHLAARPHMATDGQSSMQRWELLKNISKKSTHLLVLTATPHNGYTDSFASLIEVLDVGATSPSNLNYIDRSIAQKHVCQRRRDDVKEWIKLSHNSYDPFPERESKEEKIANLSKHERNIYKQLEKYGQELITRVERFEKQRFIAQFVILHLMKRFLSSPLALEISLKNRIEKLKEADSEYTVSHRVATSAISENDDQEDVPEEEANIRLDRSIFSQMDRQYENSLLSQILTDIKQVSKAKDSKYQLLSRKTIPELFGYSKKIIIFTRYKDTLDYLEKALSADLADVGIITIYGHLNDAQRHEKFQAFDKCDKAVLIATDCISEGMNLQHLCSQIIHYELPWNPNRLEQRNGRVDRFGQPEKWVHIRTMIVENTLDDDILANIIKKAEKMKQEFGFSPPFFNDEKQIINNLFKKRKLKNSLFELEQQTSLFDYLREINQVDETPDEDSAEREKLEQIKNECFYGHHDISLPDIEAKLKITQDTIGSEQQLSDFIRSGLAMFNCKIEQIADYYEITVNDPRLLGPGVLKKYKHITFDKTLAINKPSYELIDLSHPLVSKLVNLIKQQDILANNQYGRLCYKISKDVPEPTVIFHVLARYVVETTPSSVIEEMIKVGCCIYREKSLDSALVHKILSGNPAIGSRTQTEVIEDVSEIMKKGFWKDLILSQIDEKKHEIIKERESLLLKLANEDMPEWMQGISGINYASYDILAITVVYPG